MTDALTIAWFRQDLRTHDNPALYDAVKCGAVLPIYIYDDQQDLGAASLVWLHYALKDLSEQLGGSLQLFIGNPEEILLRLVEQTGASKVNWNRCYEPLAIARDKNLKQALQSQGVRVDTFNGALLWEPWQVKKKNGEQYKVFTPFYRKGCLSLQPPRQPLPKPTLDDLYRNVIPFAVSLSDMNFLPEVDWYRSMIADWQISEAGALGRLEQFIEDGLQNYKVGRDFPSLQTTSKLSPYLHIGQLSPNQVWYAVRSKKDDLNVDTLCSELGWREFSYYLLYHFPELPQKNWNQKFDAFPWLDDLSLFTAWCAGKTGYPIVDAGMRELWQTGYMHNRVRMIVASFLVKNLLLPWQAGAAWFWDCLVDADLASNSASWQWVAGCGADASPYFRIFNPVLQAKKFDPDGDYIRQYVPELSALPNRFIGAPWEAPALVLQEAGVQLGKCYPKPIVSLKASRERALAAYQKIK